MIDSPVPYEMDYCLISHNMFNKKKKHTQNKTTNQNENNAQNKQTKKATTKKQ